MTKTFKRRYGAEVEKVVSNISTAESHKTSQNFFTLLAGDAKKRRTFDHFHYSDVHPDIILGAVSRDLGEQGLDNGWNLLESSLPHQDSLASLQKIIDLDLRTTQKALSKENATVINASIHPLGKLDKESYDYFVSPKGVYTYLWYRGWNHMAGIDAKAQKSPTTSVNIHEAVDALTMILGASAAFIGLYANSPYAADKATGYKESRTLMWNRMTAGAKVEGDKITSRFPIKKFSTMAQYFDWMFGGRTGIHFVLTDKSSGYKGGKIIVIDQNPSVLNYLSKPSWKGYYLKDAIEGNHQNPIEVVPHISHLETMQFAQFSPTRIRFALKDEDFPLAEFLAAAKAHTKKKVENIFEKYLKYAYIEGRDAGANFPDQEIHEAGKDIAQSVVISSSAIQAGLLNNLKEAKRFIDTFDWKVLKQLRDAAIKNGLQGEVNGYSVYTFTKKVLEIASGGLNSQEHKMLAYPQWVLKTKKNGADRAIKIVESYKGNKKDALKSFVKSKQVIL